MANIDTEITWTGCELVERIPSKVSGRPIVRGTRIMPEAIVNGYDHGESIEDIREGFPALSVDQIKRQIKFAHARREQQASPLKVLLDENLGHKLRKNLGGHEIFTVRYMGWSGLRTRDLRPRWLLNCPALRQKS